MTFFLSSNNDDDLDQDFFDNDLSNDDFEYETVDKEKPGITDEGSALSSKKAKNILIFAVMIIFSLVFLYKIVFQETSTEKEKKKIEKIIASQPEENAIEATPLNFVPSGEVGIVEIPELPELKDIPAPPPPPKITKKAISEYDVVGNFKNNFVPPSFSNSAQIESFDLQQKPTEKINAEPEIKDIAEDDEEKPTELEFDPDNIDISPDTVKSRVPLKAASKSLPVAPINNEQLSIDRKQRLEKEQEKRKSPMILFDSGSSDGSENYDEILTSPYKDVTTSSANRVQVGYVGNLKNLIIQGKLIDAVLETAINTDLPGELRAIVSRDVYAEAGKNILVPKGSRLVGSYNNSISGGQSRVIIVWQRLIRPDGIDIMISSPGTDSLGKAGVPGFVDNKFFEIFTNAALVSAFTIGSTAIYDSVQGAQTSSSSLTNSPDGSVTTTSTGNSVDLAILDAVDDLGSIAESIAEGLFSAQPTIVVHQGTRVKVFVNKDIVFPNSVSGHYKILN